jgi:hypothetical protein
MMPLTAIIIAPLLNILDLSVSSASPVSVARHRKIRPFLSKYHASKSITHHYHDIIFLRLIYKENLKKTCPGCCGYAAHLYGALPWTPTTFLARPGKVGPKKATPARNHSLLFRKNQAAKYLFNASAARLSF